MKFAVLGPFEVSDDGRPLRLGGPKQRAVLAVLVLEANRAVPKDRLIDGVWGDEAPVSATGSLDTYLSRLCRLLGPDRLSRHPAGYVLRVGPGELDLTAFEELVSAAEGLLPKEPGAAAEALRRALSLWRGPALADLRHEPFAQGLVAELEDRRLAALERRVEADLAMGLGPELVPELEHLAHDHPTREQMVAHLMLALYRAGRQSDALAAMQACRRRLAEELGLQPGPGLRQLEQRILEHDEALLPRPPPPTGEPTMPNAVPAPRRPFGRGAKWAVPAVPAALIVAIAMVATVLSVVGPKASSASAGGTSMLVAIGNRSDQIARKVDLPAQPGAIAMAGGFVWSASPSANTVLQVDPRASLVVDHIPVGGEPGNLISAGGAIWVASTVAATVERIDPTTGAVTWTATLAEGDPAAMAYGEGVLWVADPTDHAVLGLSSLSGSVLQRFSLDVQPTSIAFAYGLIWVAAYQAGTVEAIDPETGQTVASVPVGNGPAALALTTGDLWVANSLDSTVSVVDTSDFVVVGTIAVGSGPAALAANREGVWVANQYSGTVSRIDPRRLVVVATVTVGSSPLALALGSGEVWVGVSATPLNDKGGTLVLATAAPFGTIDPAFHNVVPGFPFMRLAYDTLVTFEPVAGPSGLRLVPDLALQVPLPTDGGRTYSFRVRPGIRYSDGQLLTASDFRRGVERLFQVGSPGADYYGGLVGAQGCLAHPGHCNLSQGVVTDNATGSVVFQLTAPDPEFVYKLTPYAYGAPIPPGVPNHDIGTHPVPGTGPYEITSVTTRGVVFERNPYFREWSHAAQPQGNPDVIVWRYYRSQPQEVTAIERGKADWTFDFITPAQVRSLQVNYPTQLHNDPTFVVDFIPINTHAPPFNNILVRRALNYAIDRGEIARWYGGPSVATPTCQPLIPGLLGYERYCPYTLNPQPDGAWSAPNLALAKRLVAESGTKGELVNVVGATDGEVPLQVPAYIAQVLRSLGYRARLHMVPFESITETERRRFQLEVDGDWGPDYPDPSSYIPQFFACNGGNGNGWYCNPGLDQEMTKATLFELEDPAQASATWTEVDHQITDQAVWVPMVDRRWVEFTSKRLENYQFNPVWGFVPDQAVLH